jgi:hypothetical protein
MLGRRARRAISAWVCLASCGEPSPPAPARAAPTTDVAPIATAIATRTPAEIRASGNHLVGEPSPYLAQHAHNPIDWYPWSPEALALARSTGRPIFLSIGYSTCHWCHVMERESFADDDVAAYLNAHFVAIKVDREQHPDIDALYLAAVATMGGDTGWPLNVFLTPDGAPIVGGTYMPREAKAGRPGFLDVARRVHDEWTANGEAAAAAGKRVLEGLATHGGEPRAAASAADVDQAIATLARDRDEVRGGFGTRQKFPNPTALLAELRWATAGATQPWEGTARPPGNSPPAIAPSHRSSPSSPGNASRASGAPDEARLAAREHVETTLVRMRDGALRDPLAGTFHRYCVDADWTLPHFEKTLYDNAQLASLYLEASLRLGDPQHRATALAILDDLLAHWRTSSGGLAIGFDADDPGGEGRYYAWTIEELDAVLSPPESAAVASVWGVATGSRTELDGRALLIRREVGDDATIALAEAALPRLREARAKRPAPARDDKVLVAPNALAIEALVLAAGVADEPRYLEAARALGELMFTRLVRDGRVERGLMGDVALGEGFAEDHALLGRAALRLHRATGDRIWLARAHELASTLLRDFWDDARHGVRATATARQGLPVAPLAMDDHAAPAGGAVAIGLWLEVGALVGDDAMWSRGEAATGHWRRAVVEGPRSSATLLEALRVSTGTMHELVVAGDSADPATAALLAEVDAVAPGLAIARVPAEGITDDDAARWPALAGKIARAGKPTAYLCTRGSCRMPTSDPATLRAQLVEAAATHG